MLNIRVPEYVSPWIHKARRIELAYHKKFTDANYPYSPYKTASSQRTFFIIEQ